MGEHDLADRVAALERLTDRLADENRALRERLESPPPTAPAAPAPASPARAERGTVSRRGLLASAAGAAAAGAVGAAGLLAGAEPAGAASGQGFVIGEVNTETTATALVATNTPGYGLGVIDTSFDGTFGSTQPALLGYAAGTVFNTGAWLQADDGGLALRATVNGFAAQAVYVEADSDYGLGINVDATGTEAVGLSASGTGYGVQASSSAGPAALLESDVAQLQLVPRTAGRQAPHLDTTAHDVGQLVRDDAGTLWLCTAGGTPGTWRSLAANTSAGAFYVLPTPVRVYDSRPGFAPTVGPKTPLAAGANRTIDLKANSSTVPAGATAAMVNCLVVDAVAGNGNFTIWKNGAAKPASNTIVWGGTTGRASSLAVSALDASAKVQVSANIQTDIVIDVVGYYL